VDRAVEERADPPIQRLHGVGPKLAEKLAELDIARVGDLLFHLPLRYEDRTRVLPIGGLQPGQRGLIDGTVRHAGITRGRRRSLAVILADGTGNIQLRFFHFHPRQRDGLKPGTRLRAFGEVREGYRGYEMVHPEYRRYADAASPKTAQHLTPVYPTVAGLHQRTLRQLAGQALDWMHRGKLALPDLLPASAGGSRALPGLAEALEQLHRPPSHQDPAELLSPDHPARRRLVLEELTAHFLAARQLSQRRDLLRAPALTHADLAERLRAALPFDLTGAQARAAGEIAADLARERPMLRLLQGDVGSGKTVVAALAAAQAMASGCQAAFAAPTELLAEQHLRSLREWFEPLGIELVWLSGRVTGRRREQALARIAAGAPLVVGTHALMQPGVEFRRLGLAVIDEQHRFGVHQRLALRDKAPADDWRPHQLIMTATPIPRTLAMTAYAGLESSLIDELPPGRMPVTTVAASTERRGEVIERVARACCTGRQAYWVCTLIEASDSLEAEAAAETAQRLREALPELSVDLLHGRLKAEEKDARMRAFRDRQTQLLVATTVIEVGVDVPNASLMIIENAERLGLAQLHQLRGRVGRGSKESACVLMYQPPLGALARARLETLRATNDGFAIAEKDLELRGPGEVLGTRQAGLVRMRVADLMRDHHLLGEARRVGETLLAQAPDRVNALLARWVGGAERYGEV